MNNNETIIFIKYNIFKQSETQITVEGTSMFPVLISDDIATIIKCDEYSIGDILVFEYKGNIIIHRLLKIIKNRYFCKGDNAFALECIEKTQIIGKVKSFIRNNQCHNINESDPNQIDASFLVNREFVKLNYDKTKTIMTPIYQEYKKRYLDDNNLRR